MYDRGWFGALVYILLIWEFVCFFSLSIKYVFDYIDGRVSQCIINFGNLMVFYG